MHSRIRIFPSLLASILLAGVLSQAASCTLDQNGLDDTPTQNQACQEDANCDDKDQCTVNACGESKICEYRPVDGLAPEQKAGDCQQGFCDKGVFTQNPDDTDLPDDLESCTKDSCANGMPVHEMLPDDTICTFGDAAGLCKGGKCTVECSPAKPCNDGNPCTEDTCNASTGACTFAKLDGLPTPDYTPVVGDCSQQICINGVSTAIADDADLPNDNNVCTTDACSNGTPSQTPANAGAPCMAVGGTGVCDNAGTCVQCINPEDCPAIVPANPCKQRTCTNSVCGVMDLDKVDIASKAGDCRKSTCTNGQPVEQIDNNDKPNDNNPCTQDLCTAGTPSNPPENMGVSCGGTLTCDGAGKCDGCTTASNCGTSDECKTYSCTGGKCGISYTPQNTATMAGQMTGDCKLRVCDGAGNAITTVDANDKPVDMKECTEDLCAIDGTPSNPYLPLNTACSENGGTLCDGLGACLVAQGGTCSIGTACITGFCTDGVCCDNTCTSECMACNVTNSVGMCSFVPATNDDAPFCTGTNSCDGMGACKRDNGQACGMGTECSSGFCADGVCCDTACGETCKSCNLTGNIGTCTLVPNDGLDPTGTMPCNNPYRCDGNGQCKALNTVACNQGSECLSGYCVDGFCCNNICNQLCEACSNVLTGAGNGVCKPILNGKDPQNECPNGDCNGSGNCMGGGGSNLPNGSPCGGSAQCTSGFCIDGVCCSSACTDTCKTCNLSGQVGTCVNVPMGGTDPTGSMPCAMSGYQCDGMGVCKGVNGVPCTTAMQCVSGYCVDGFCCGNICNQTCKSCASTNTTMANGVCANIKAGTDPDNECNGGTPNCNGNGMCGP